MTRAFPWLVAALAACTLAPACVADALSDGRALYKAGDYAGAIAKLEQATRDRPGDAHAWWQLNFAYNKVGRYADALQAVRQAGKADPRHTFASEAGKYESVLQRMQSKAGATGSKAPGTSASSAGGITRQLTEGDVYVAPGMPADAARLQQVAKDLRPTVVKFAVFNSRSNSRTLSREADRIRTSLSEYTNRGEGYVIACSRSGVAVSSSSMKSADLRDMARQAAPRMSGGDLTGGLETLARGLVRARAARSEARTGVAAGGLPAPAHSNAGSILLGLAGVVAIVVVAVVAARTVRARRRMREMRGPIERLKGDVITQMNSLDAEIPQLDTASAARAREARVSAGTRLDEASRILTRARSEKDLNRAQSLLDAALADLAGARSAVGRQGAAGVGGGPLPPVYGSPGAASVVGTGAETNWSDVPEAERGVCFFCSRPSLMSELTPVTVRLSDQPQKVLACATDLDTIRSGEVPQIRAFQRDGQYVPWYADRGYDPYRDYYDRGYGRGSFLQDMIILSMVDNMFWNWHHPVGWGWGGGWGGWGGGYAFYADHPGYRDHYSSEAASQQDPDIDAGGSDFLQDVGGDGRSAGSDFTGSDRS